MSYRLKSFKNKINKKISIIYQYGKACGFYYSEGEKSLFTVIPSIFKAHFWHGITPFLYSYYRLENVSENEWGEYVVDQKEFNKMLAGGSPVEDRRDVGNKLLFYQHCITKNLPIVPVLCVFTSDRNSVSEGVNIVVNIDKFREILSKSSGELFVKPILGASGIGTFAVYRENENYWFAGRSGSIEDLYWFLHEKTNSGSDFLVQPRMKTHSSLLGIVSKKGLSTIRIVTVRRNEESKIIMACLKIVRGANEHDNFSKGMSNNLIVSIDVNTGVLNKAWGSLSTDWPQMVQYPNHPDTGNKIEGVVLPLWKEISELVLRAHESIPSLQTIGWDVALTDEGVFIVEANTAYDAASFQLFAGRGLKSEFEKHFLDQK